MLKQTNKSIQLHTLSRLVSVRKLTSIHVLMMLISSKYKPLDQTNLYAEGMKLHNNDRKYRFRYGWFQRKMKKESRMVFYVKKEPFLY